ncbi:hypothetical protein V8E51_008934 [Hyaloscypha variabilis]
MAAISSFEESNKSATNKKTTTSEIKATAIAGTPTFKISKNPTMNKQATTMQIQARASTMESTFRPSTSETGPQNTQGAMEIDAIWPINNNHFMGTVTKNNTKSQLSEDRMYLIRESIKSEASQLEQSSTVDFHQTNPDIETTPIIEQPAKGHQQTLALITAFSDIDNSTSTFRSGAFFLEILNSDIRYQIYDHFADTELEVIINKTKKYHSPLSALKATCTKTRAEINKWTATRKSLTLTHNPTFGLLNLPLTTFRFSWHHRLEIQGTKLCTEYQRCYSPAAAKQFLPDLELWQRAMIFAKSHRAGDINYEVRNNEKLENVGPARDPNRRDAHSIRMLMLNNHDNYNSPSKFEISAKDFVVLDPKRYECDEDVPHIYKCFYFRSPYVWSKDCRNHDMEQEYCFVHPGTQQNKWVRGQEACGSDAIRNGWTWNRTFNPAPNRPLINAADDVITHEDVDDDWHGEVHLRGGAMMDLDDEDEIMGDQSKSEEEHNDWDMDHVEDQRMKDAGEEKEEEEEEEEEETKEEETKKEDKTKNKDGDEDPMETEPATTKSQQSQTQRQQPSPQAMIAAILLEIIARQNTKRSAKRAASQMDNRTPESRKRRRMDGSRANRRRGDGSGEYL